jgi:single-strand DNA-binding protein
MFNNCFLGGRVITTPTLRYFGKDKPVTAFTLEILVGNYRYGRIKVECYSKLAMGAVKHLILGDRVAVAGFLSGGVYRQDNGTYQYELRMAASELASLREDPDIE